MAPVEEPELLTYIFVQQPKLKAGDTGADPVAKMFKSIMESSLKYLNIVPNGEEAVTAKVLGNFTGKDAGVAQEELVKLGYKAVTIGNGGKVTVHYPEEGAKLAEGSVVILKTEGQTSLPNFTGWSKKSVLSFKMLSGLDMRINGDGYVTSQSLSKDTVPSLNEPIVIHLQPPSEINKIKKEVDEDEEEGEPIIGG